MSTHTFVCVVLLWLCVGSVITPAGAIRPSRLTALSQKQLTLQPKRSIPKQYGRYSKPLQQAATPAPMQLTVNLEQRSSFTVPEKYSAMGVEYLNHEFYGGLYSQQVFGESFEEQPVPPAEGPETALGHQGSRWIFKQGFLAAGSDLRSGNSTLEAAEAWCGASAVCCGFTFPGNASTADPSATYDVRFKLLCGFANSPLWSSYVKPAPAEPPAQRGFRGCAGRSNSTALLAGVSTMWLGVAEGVSGGEFSMQTKDPFNGPQYQRITFPSTAQILKTMVQGSGSAPRVGVANHGLYCQHGMVFEAGKDYQGYTYMRTPGASDVAVTASLEDSVTGEVLARQVLVVKGGLNWTRYDMTFVPGTSTTCPGMRRWVPGKDGSVGSMEALASCSGSLVLSLGAPGTVDVDYTYLSPGAWALQPSSTAGDIGLPARADIPAMLTKEGITWLRFGGSMCNHGPYRWADFRGPRELRQPYKGDWYRQPGQVQSRGFGMFEMADLAQALGVELIVTINSEETAEAMADFVEYCWGNASTAMGALRASHGHPLPYNISRVEIGNEDPSISGLAADVARITAAMEARQAAVGAPPLVYYLGHNLFDAEVSNATRAAATQDIIRRTRHLGDRVFWDLHVGADPASVALWEQTFVDLQGLVRRMGSKMRAVVLEENGSDHGLLRGVGHAVYSNAMQRHADFVTVHGYANGLEAWQGMDLEQSFPQGQLMTLPNATIPQPTWWAIRMLTQSHQPYVLNSTLAAPASAAKAAAVRPNRIGIVGRDDETDGGVHAGESGGEPLMDVIACGSGDGPVVGSVAVVRVANWGPDVNMTIDFLAMGEQFPPRTVQAVVMAGDMDGMLVEEDNTPGNPERIMAREEDPKPYLLGMEFTFKRTSFTVLRFEWR